MTTFTSITPTGEVLRSTTHLSANGSVPAVAPSTGSRRRPHGYGRDSIATMHAAPEPAPPSAPGSLCRCR
jgi:hypothetical protein